MEYECMSCYLIANILSSISMWSQWIEIVDLLPFIYDDSEIQGTIIISSSLGPKLAHMCNMKMTMRNMPVLIHNTKMQYSVPCRVDAPIAIMQNLVCHSLGCASRKMHLLSTYHDDRNSVSHMQKITNQFTLQLNTFMHGCDIHEARAEKKQTRWISYKIGKHLFPSCIPAEKLNLAIQFFVAIMSRQMRR